MLVTDVYHYGLYQMLTYQSFHRSMVVIHTAVFAYSIAVTMVVSSCFIDKKPATEKMLHL